MAELIGRPAPQKVTLTSLEIGVPPGCETR